LPAEVLPIEVVDGTNLLIGLDTGMLRIDLAR
jgi:hypothetical protein